MMEPIVEQLKGIAFSGEKDVKAGDKLRALELLGKHFGLFKEAEAGGGDAEKEPLWMLLAAIREMRKARGERVGGEE